MKTSTVTNELDKALTEFKKEMKAVIKNSGVSMTGTTKTGKSYDVNYDYAPLEDIQEQANPVLAKFGLTINQFLDSEKLLVNGNEQLFPVIVTRVAHASGQWVSSAWPLDLSSINKEQDRGSKITYNKRYCYTAALDIMLKGEDNDAVGVANDAKQTQKSNQSKGSTNINVGSSEKKSVVPDNLPLKDFIMTHGNDRVKGKKLGEIPIADLNEMVDYFTKKRTANPTGPVIPQIKKTLEFLAISARTNSTEAVKGT